jgi:hypothetical protein
MLVDIKVVDIFCVLIEPLVTFRSPSILFVLPFSTKSAPYIVAPPESTDRPPLVTSIPPLAFNVETRRVDGMVNVVGG